MYISYTNFTIEYSPLNGIIHEPVGQTNSFKQYAINKLSFNQTQ